MEKLIFLDFDGVINSHAGWKNRPFLKNPSREQIEDRDICPENIKLFKIRTIKETS